MRFYEQQRTARNPVTTKMLKERAASILDENKASGSESVLPTNQCESFKASDSWLSHWKHRHNLDLQQSNSSAGNFVCCKKSSAFSVISRFKELKDEEGCLVTGGELTWNIIWSRWHMVCMSRCSVPTSHY